jgi:hypothetical protein
MKSFQPPVAALGTLLALGLGHSAQAARLSLTTPGQALDLIEQTATVDGIAQARSLSSQLVDASGPGTVLLSDTQIHGPTPLGALSLSDGHSHLLAVDTTGATTDLLLDASHFWSLTGQGTLSAYSLTQSLSVDGLTFEVQGDAGEHTGQSVTVQFSGLAQALVQGAAQSNDLGLTLDVVQGSNTLASHNGLWTGGASEAVNLSFSARVGDRFTVLLSAYNSAQVVSALAVSDTEFGSALQLQGHMTVTAVPEPSVVWLTLTGGLLAAGLTRRNQRQR